MPISEIESRLSTAVKLNIDKTRLYARLSAGCFGWALSVVQDESYLQNRKSILSEFIPMINSSWNSRLSYIQKIPSDRAGAEAMIKLWVQWYRDILLVKYNCEEAIINLDYMTELKSWASTLTIVEIKEFIDSLTKALNNLVYNANLHLLFEVIMLDMPKKEKRTEYAINSVNGNQS
jgi:DNA polymerase III gamma/tau subunit